MIHSFSHWSCLLVVIALTASTSFADATAPETLKDCADCPEMVVLPRGTFTMGSFENEADRGQDESPAHSVTIGGDLAIGKFEVTHDEFAAFVADTKREMKPCFFDPVFSRTGRHPAICLTWNDAQAYVAWLTQKTEHRYRLPSEAEWEFAARAAKAPGTYPRFYFGDDETDICANSNTSVKHCDDGFANTAPVGSYPPNNFGLHDTIGNVWELIEECPSANYEGTPADGSVRQGGDCTKRVIRGAGWINYQVHHLRTANRGWFGPEMYDVMTGLRVVREP